MTRRLEPLVDPVHLDAEGHDVPARAGEPVASALVAAGRTLFSRSIKYHRPRGAFCFTGACAQCLMRVDGVPNVQTCLTPARAGMRLERQNAFPDASLDIFQANDFVFSTWFNHHEFLAGVPILEDVLLRVARQLAGLGLLPDGPAPLRQPPLREVHRTLIVGGGASGLQVARALDAASQPYLLLERDAAVGGRLRLAGGLQALHLPPTHQVRLGWTVVGLYADDGPPFLVASDGARLAFLHFEHLVLCVGGHPTFLALPNNDLPGVYAGRAVLALLRRDRVLPGQRIAVVGDAAESEVVAQAVEEAGGKVVARGRKPVRIHGLREVSAVTVEGPGGTEKLSCDAVALCAPSSPAFELARSAGAQVSWRSDVQRFVVEADGEGRTSVPGLLVAGEARAPMPVAQAQAEGRRVGQALAERLAALPAEARP